MTPLDVLATLAEADRDLDALTLADRCRASQDRTLAVMREMLGLPAEPVLIEDGQPPWTARWGRVS